MSDTPRTEAAVKIRLPDVLYWVDPNFARQLERELIAANKRKVVQIPEDIWKLSDGQTTENISMAELRKIIESERRIQIELNGHCPEVHQANGALEMVWRIANGYEDCSAPIQ